MLNITCKLSGGKFFLLLEPDVTKTPFLIDHIDPLGQGVSKIDDQIVFVRKTLPAEEGEAQVLKSSKGVQFADVVSTKSLSSKRMKAECVHFQQCQGCHFLHTDYEHELQIKKSTLEREIEKSLRRSGTKFESKVSVLKAPRRLGYRNRIQLHYDRKKEKLGMVDPLKKQLVEIPQCLIALPEIQSQLQELYRDKNWLKQVKGPGQGHVELQMREGDGQQSVEIFWNSRYSAGGFSQVYAEMNDVLVDLVTSSIQNLSSGKLIWDLFGGGGNLTQKINNKEILVVDSYLPQEKKGGHQKFFQTNLYDPSALEQCLEHLEKPDILLIDPPRTGFKDLSLWLEKLQPEHLFYISCHQATQLRDLQACYENYELKEVQLLDLFPGTYHFETFFHLQKKA